MSNEIDRWICSGAEVTEGLRLLSIYAPNKWLDALVRKAPKEYSHLLKKALLPFATDVPFSQTLTKGGRFREDWPFLSEPDCPTELKALAADMITSWHNYVNAHEDLFKCTTPEECFEAAEKTVRNFYHNSVSRTEFQYYKEHHRILGKHPIFALTKKLDNLRRMPITELIRKRRNVQDSIWRAEREIKKGDRPDLKVSREERLSRLKMTLDEINRMIKEYEGTDNRTSR
jgi:hypothetical protein